MYLKNDKIVVSIDGLVLRSHNTGAPQYVLDPSAIAGWHDGVDVRRETTIRPTSWGDFREKGRLASRLISLTGTAVGRSANELHQLRDWFMGALIAGDTREMSLTDSDGTRYIDVQLGGKPSWIQLADTFASWKLELYAPDPRIFGTKKTVSIENEKAFGGIDFGAGLSYPLDYNNDAKMQYVFLDNKGNSDSWPSFTVFGNYGSGFTITNNLGKELVYTGAVSMTSPVTIDQMAGAAYQNGVDRSTYLSKRGWFAVAPGSTIQPSFIPKEDSYGWCDIMYRDTWI